MLRKEEQQPSRADKESAAADLFVNDFAQHDRILRRLLSVHLMKYMDQGAKKIIFTACHSGKLKLSFTSPDVFCLSLEFKLSPLMLTTHD